MNDGKDNLEKQLDKILLGNRLKAVSSQGIRSHQNNLSILTVHQVAEVILNLVIPITNFTSSSEKYCTIWHDEIGKDIEGIKSMLVILENAYSKVDVHHKR
ncbi:MAG TPA: hypothetical protein VIK21_03140 [Desulfuromonadaceae bacterium]